MRTNRNLGIWESRVMEKRKSMMEEGEEDGNMGTEKFIDEHVRAFQDFIIVSCPSLKKMHIQ